MSASEGGDLGRDESAGPSLGQLEQVLRNAKAALEAGLVPREYFEQVQRKYLETLLQAIDNERALHARRMEREELVCQRKAEIEEQAAALRSVLQLSAETLSEAELAAVKRAFTELVGLGHVDVPYILESDLPQRRKSGSGSASENEERHLPAAVH